LRTHLPHFNGQFIAHKDEGGALEGCRIKQYCDLVRNFEGPLQNVFVSDASDSAAFVYSADGTFEFTRDFVFDLDEARASSGLRELLAVRHAWTFDQLFFEKFRGQLLYWQTDSQNCAIFLTRGSRKPVIQDIVLEIKLLEKQLGLVLIPVWTPREHERILVADLGSKFSLNTDEWSLDRDILRNIFSICNFVPDVDVFATQHNTVAPTFFSRFFDSHAAGINFFAQALQPGKKYFCCPPVSLIIPCIRKLQAAPGVEFLLIVPEWHSAAFWPILFPHRHILWPRATVFASPAKFFFANQATSKVFSHRPNFGVLIVHVA